MGTENGRVGLDSSAARVVGEANPAAPDRPRPTRFGPLLQLQRQAGNAAVGALLRAGIAQAKLRVTPADDPLEVEADRVADAITAGGSGACSCGGTCDECQKSPKVIMRAPAEPGSHDVQLSEEAESVARDIGPGQPLDSTTRSHFEDHFGADLSAVRIHDNASAAAAAETVQARAFTMGSAIAFNAGEFATGSREGHHLLAHELTHTIQNGGAQAHDIGNGQAVRASRVRREMIHRDPQDPDSSGSSNFTPEQQARLQQARTNLDPQGSAIVGVLITDDGQEFELKSGGGQGFGSHVEGKAVAKMNELGVTTGTLLVELEPCQICDRSDYDQEEGPEAPLMSSATGKPISRQTPRISSSLPIGARLTVVGPQSTGDYRGAKSSSSEGDTPSTPSPVNTSDPDSPSEADPTASEPPATSSDPAASGPPPSSSDPAATADPAVAADTTASDTLPVSVDPAVSEPPPTSAPALPPSAIPEPTAPAPPGGMRPGAMGYAGAGLGLLAVVAQYMELLASYKQIAVVYARYRSNFFGKLGGQSQQYMYSTGDVVTVYAPPDYATLTAYLQGHANTTTTFSQFLVDAAYAGLDLRNGRWSFYIGNDAKDQPVYYDVDPVITDAQSRAGAAADDQFARRRKTGTREISFKPGVALSDRHLWKVQANNLHDILDNLDGDQGVLDKPSFFVVGETDARRGSAFSSHYYIVEPANQDAAAAFFNQAQALVRADFTE